jgi:hypothetical protein
MVALFVLFFSLLLFLVYKGDGTLVDPVTVPVLARFGLLQPKRLKRPVHANGHTNAYFTTKSKLHRTMFMAST